MASFWTRKSPQVRPSSPNRFSKKRQNHGRSLTASGERVTRRESETIRRVVQPWQGRAFNYYDALGEIKYAAQFYTRMLAPLRLYAAEKNEDGEFVETENEEAIAALERIQDPGGGRTGLLGAYGRLMFLSGEAQLFVSVDPETNVEQWEMLSSDELRYEGGSYMRYRAPSLGAENYSMSDGDGEEEGDWVPVDSQNAVAYRLWQRHPRYSMLADSTMQGVLDLCEELLLMTRAVRARARSRIAGAGILWIDEKLSPAPPDAAPDEDPEEDLLLSELTEAMTAPMADEGSPSSVVPLLVRVPVPEQSSLRDLVYHMELVDPTQLYPETGLRYECIKRIAIGLDMPPEILLGMEQANHWTAWQIDEQTWKGHGQPKAQQLCDDLTSSYFRPYLRQAMDANEASRFVIAYDASKIINHPDRAKDAKDLHKEIVISDEALRDATGFTEDDAPDLEERTRRIGMKANDTSLAIYGVPTVRGGDIEPAAGEVVGKGEAPTTGAEVVTGAPPEPTVQASAARVMGAADVALLRAREAAGNRIRSMAKRDPETLRLLEEVRAGDVASTLGRVKVRQLGAGTEVDLVRGASALILDSLRVWGITDDGIAKMIGDQIEKHAARTLYDVRPRPMPDEFPRYVAGLLEAGR